MLYSRILSTQFAAHYISSVVTSCSSVCPPSLLVVNGFTHSLDKLLRDLFHAVLFLSMFSTPLHNLFLRFTTDYKVAVYTNVSTADYFRHFFTSLLFRILKINFISEPFLLQQTFLHCCCKMIMSLFKRKMKMSPPPPG